MIRKWSSTIVTRQTVGAVVIHESCELNHGVVIHNRTWVVVQGSLMVNVFPHL